MSEEKLEAVARIAEAAGEGITKAVEVVGEGIVLPAVQPSAQAGGKALGTLMNAFNLLFAPLERAHLRSEAKTERLRRELAKGFEEIPPERQVEPPLEVVGPALESLKYVEDETLQDMYTSLLLSTMDSETQLAAHPAFVRIISELSPFDAKNLKEIYETIVFSGRPLSLYSNPPDDGSVYRRSLDNFERLKLIRVDSDLENFVRCSLSDYERTIRLGAPVALMQTPDIIKYIEMTNFGQDFCSTCIPKS